jgi:ABC-2 type transport system permease protein
MTSQAAIAVANVIFFLLAILGGLWMPVFTFPAVMQALAWCLPSFHLAQLALIAQGMVAADFVWLHIAAVAGWTLGLAGLVAWAIRRDRA